MKKAILTVLTTGLVMFATVTQAAFSLDLSPIPGSQIAFYGTGSQFDITPSISPPWQWQITSGGTGVAWGLPGQFTGGPWSYGPITVNGADQTASVVGPLGGLIIQDAALVNLTGTINWVEVSTSDFIGGVNAKATVNISNLLYNGANADLITLATAAAGNGSVNLSFQFAPGMTLTALTTGNGPYLSSYSGTLTPVPEPTTILAGALLLLPLGASTIRILRRKS